MNIYAVSAQAHHCGNQPRVQFLANGQAVDGTIVESHERDGRPIPCRKFGGWKTSSPGIHLEVFANFGVEGTVDLDALDESFLKNARRELRSKFHRFNFSIVDDDWFSKTPCTGYGAIWADGSAVFIPARAIRDGKLKAVWDDFFSQDPYQRAACLLGSDPK